MSEARRGDAASSLAGLSVGVLGPTVVSRGGVQVALPGQRLRTLLTRLAVDGGRPVSVPELTDAVWGAAEPPGDPANALQSLVSRLRRTLGDPSAVVQHPTGYRLGLAAVDLDVAGFESAVRTGHAELARGDADAALATLSLGLRLWRGEPLADAGDAPYAGPLRARWIESHLEAEADRLDACLRLDRAEEVVDELAELTAAHPLRERLVVLLLTALQRTGRTPEALDRYEQTRRYLADELGVDPGTELQQLHLELLRGPAVPPPAPTRPSTNLPVALTSFVGRADDLVRVDRLLDAGRLTTLLGPGGAGKTRLAIEAAQHWLARTGRPTWLVELAPVTDPDAVVTEVLAATGGQQARVLERTERVLTEAFDRLVTMLADVDCLVVLDNCEHLIDPVASFVDRLLARVPGARVLTTSREPLGLFGEALCPVAPLDVPVAGEPLADALASPALRLFLDRSTPVAPDFVLDEATLPYAVEIVRRLDGLPLAIELAAARLRVLPVSEVAARLSDRFRLLTGGSRTSLPRHRTLRAVVEWSWDLLTPDERALAERVAVFPAGVDVAAARAVAGPGRSAADVEDLLLSLVDKSLLQAVDPPTPGSGLRLRMLETLREYGVERLADQGGLAGVRADHARYFTGLAVELEPLVRSAAQLDAFARLDAERDNFAAAVRFLVDEFATGDALRLCLALGWYWSLTAQFEASAGWFEAIVARHPDRDDPLLVYAEAAVTLAQLSAGAGGASWSELRGVLTDLSVRSLATPAPSEFPWLGAVRAMLPLFAARDDLAQQALAEALGSPDPWVRAATHATQANFAENSGDVALMRSAVELAVAEFSALGDRWGLASAVNARAQLAVLDGRLDDAVADYSAALGLVSALGSAEDQLFMHLRLGDLALRRADVAGAREHLDALRAFRGFGPGRDEQLRFADNLELAVLRREGRREEARRRAAEIRAELSSADGTPLAGHARAFTLTALATLAVELHESGTVGPATIWTDLRDAYATAVETEDQPIIATVGLAVAAAIDDAGDPGTAAEVLGAADRLRGAADPTDLDVIDLTARLRAALGAAYPGRYAAGWTLDRADARTRIDPDRFLSR